MTDIEKLEALAGKATPGPWKIYGLQSSHGGLTISAFADSGPTRHVAYMAWPRDERGGADATLIVALANDALPLLRKLQAEIDTLRSEFRAIEWTLGNYIDLHQPVDVDIALAFERARENVGDQQ